MLGQRSEKEMAHFNRQHSSVYSFPPYAGLVARPLQIVSYSCKIKVWEWPGNESAEDKWKVGGEEERANGGEGRRRKERREEEGEGKKDNCCYHGSH